jgi:hypothetical protein
LSNACFQSSITRKRVDWHPNPERKAARNGVNLSISTSTFPDRLKEAQVAPIHKKNSVLEKGNYRPVSVLPAISKIHN